MKRLSSLAVFVAIACVSGCNPRVASQSVNQSSVKNDDADAARAMVDRSVNTYRSATAYADSGFVRLSYSIAGQAFEDRAPLAVSYQSPNQVKLGAYAVQLMSDGHRLQATINDSETNHFDGQCLSVPVSKQLTLEQVYADRVVAQFAGAGMGGPAPQLELLLSDSPLAAWLQDPAQLSLGKQSRIDGHDCQSIVIAVDPLRYVLWIDEDTFAIRRIELPWQAIAPDLADDPQMSDASLTIELADARFESSLPHAQFAAQLPPLCIPVAALVMPPPLAPHRLVGSDVPEFELKESTGRFTVSQAGSDREATVMIWVADHFSSQQASVAVQQVVDSLPAETQQHVRAAVVMAEPHSQSGTGIMLRRWGVGMPWIDDLQAVGRDVFHVTKAPCLIVTGGTGRVEIHQQPLTDGLLRALPSLLADIIARQPIGQMTRDQYIAAQALYQRNILQNGSLSFPLSSDSIILTASNAAITRDLN